MNRVFISALACILFQAGCGAKSEREVKLRKLAESGDADAQLRLAFAYSLGDESISDVGREYIIGGIHQDSTQSAAWMLKSAESGNSQAERITSNNYFFGIGVPVSYPNCVFWLQMAMAQGDPDALPQLTNLKVIAEKDPAGAYTPEQRKSLKLALDDFEPLGADAGLIEKLKREAVSGEPTAALRIGNRYLDGVGVRKNHLLGWNWLLRAANLGNVEAQTRIGVCFCQGDGVSKDAVAGNYWLMKAATKGYDVAEYNLGVSFLEGEGVAKDKVMGLSWIKRSAAHGNTKAIELLKIHAQ